ncbi:MAG: V-type ATP synthase subunit D [Synergistaceae bacterium]|jgi:V/A-type H+-transporting ATPase subunit D|nr:V-type ATP synthase subunit D [Synergistaceae bacterium]
MTDKVTATRSGMTRIQSALRLARRGHGLLEQKRKILMGELMGRIGEVREIQSSMHAIFGEAYFSLQMANISMGIESVEKIALLVPEENRFVVRLRSVMGIDIPEVDKIEPNLASTYSMGGTATGSSSALDNAYVNARRVVALIARAAEIETSVYRLAVQIRKTLRRVNALEKVFIPRSERQIRLITAALDENEREDLTRIKLSSSNFPAGDTAGI